MLDRVLSFCLSAGSSMRLIRWLSVVCCRREFSIWAIVLLCLSKFVHLLHCREFGVRKRPGLLPQSLAMTHLSAGQGFLELGSESILESSSLFSDSNSRLEMSLDRLELSSNSMSECGVKVEELYSSDVSSPGTEDELSYFSRSCFL